MSWKLRWSKISSPLPAIAKIVARRPLSLATLLILITGLAILEPAVLGGDVLSGGDAVYFSVPFTGERPAGLTRPSNLAVNDATYLFLPHLAEARRQIRSGRLPLWDPYIGAGRPLGAEQGGPLYPLNWPVYVLPFWRALGLVALLKVITAGLGAFVFARSVGIRSPAALLAGLTLPFGTMFIAWLSHGQAEVIALLPWMFFFAGRLAADGRWVDAAALGFAAGITPYSGHPESALVAALGTGAYFLHRLHADRDEAGNAGRKLSLLVAASGIGLLVGGLAIFPLLEAVGQASHLSKGQGTDSLSQLGAGLVFPEIWGRPDKLVYNVIDFGTPSSDFTGRAYVGVLPLLFAVGALLRMGSDARVRFFLAISAVSLSLMLGGPIHDLAARLPLLSLVGLHQFIWLALFAIVMLAALGLDSWLAGPVQLRMRMLVVMTVAAVLPVVLALILRPDVADAWREALKQLPALHQSGVSAHGAQLGSIVRWALLSAVGLVLVAVGARRPNMLPLAVAAMIGLTVLDLVALDRGYQPHVSVGTANPRTPVSIGIVQHRGAQGRIIGADGAFAPNLAERYGVFDARAEDLPDIKRYTDLFTALGGTFQRGFGLTQIAGDPARYKRLLDVFGVRYVLDDGRSPISMPVVHSGSDGRLLENRSAFPPAWVAYGWRSSTAGDAALTTTPPETLLRTPVIDGPAASRPTRTPVTPVHARRIDEETVVLEPHTRRDGFLVLDDLYYPGWTAHVDGRSVPIRRANGTFRAVWVPAGNHTVTFAYRPQSVLVGAIATLLGILATAAVLVLSRSNLLAHRRSRPA